MPKDSFQSPHHGFTDLDSRLPADYEEFKASIANTPWNRVRAKAMEARDLEKLGRLENAKALRMDILALAKICDVTCRPEEVVSCSLLVACSHFHLAKSYHEDTYIKQAITHSLRAVDVLEKVHKRDCLKQGPREEIRALRCQANLFLSALLLENDPPNVQAAVHHLHVAGDFSEGAEFDNTSKLRYAFCCNAIGSKTLQESIRLRAKRRKLEKKMQALKEEVQTVDPFEERQINARMARTSREMKDTQDMEEGKLGSALSYLDKAVDVIMEVIAFVEEAAKQLDGEEDKEWVAAQLGRLYRFCSDIMLAMSRGRALGDDLSGSEQLLGEILSVQQAYGVITPRVLAEVHRQRAAALLKVERLDEALATTNDLIDILDSRSKTPRTNSSRRKKSSKDNRHPCHDHGAFTGVAWTEGCAVEARKLKAKICIALGYIPEAIQEYKHASDMLEAQHGSGDQRFLNVEGKIRLLEESML
ncbi:hypothetical protein BSKO_09989 [Bryopsis sp. KO-2023]|nr:hypothetical protein BSKO_09989 [Bryopsis sp. KO-2023]